MFSLTAVAVDLHTSPQDVPSIPAWFAEVAVLAQHCAHQGIFEALHHVRVARGRMGHYEVSDFVALLLGYAASGEPTLEAFWERVAPFAGPYMALFGRDRLPHRSTLSRFLAAVDAAGLAALRHLFEQDLTQRGPTAEECGGLYDRQGTRLVIFDVDGTRQAARQRALVTSSDFPPPRRRLVPVCAPGYTGRQRGEVVRTRTTILQAHTPQWLGTYGHPGNGDYSGELLDACRTIAAYPRAKGLPLSQGLLRLDGLYGTASVLAHIQRYGLGFVGRGRDYQLLAHPRVQERLRHPCDQTVPHPETGVQREVFEVGYRDDWLEPLPDLELTCRVIVTRRVAPADPEESTVGKRIGALVYELFLVSHPATSLSAVDVLALYNGRGAFEQVLSDEDQEQDPDRWCSHTAWGQEFWQIVCQWVWNMRLELGQVGRENVLRWTDWAEPEAVSVPAPLPPTAPEEPVEDETVALYGPLELAREWAKARGRLAGTDFELLDAGTVRCPAGHLLRPRERRTLPTGDLRILYAAKAADCRACALAPQCRGTGASGEQPRRVSAVRRFLGHHQRPKQAPWQTPPMGETHAEQEGRNLLWCDISGRSLRRRFVAWLRGQRVTISGPLATRARTTTHPQPRRWTRAQRAHRRLRWTERLARNAVATDAPSYTVTLCGIAPALAAYLGLPSACAS